MPRGVLAQPLGRKVLDLESATLQIVADEVGAGFILLARGIHRRDADEIGRVLDDLIRCAIDFSENAVNGLH
jgi:hypothetical protein